MKVDIIFYDRKTQKETGKKEFGILSAFFYARYILKDKKIIEKTLYKANYEILDKLECAKILFYSPEDAAKHLNLVYDDLEKWWDDPFTQQIKKEFCEGYIRTDSNWLDKWCDLLMSEEKA